MAGYTAYDREGSKLAVTLIKQLGFGAEGIVFTTNLGDDVVAKIYPAEERSSEAYESKYINKYNKCKYFIENGFERDGIAFPSHLLYDMDGNFAGYLMPRASGDALAEIINPVILNEEYPDLTRAHLVDVCISILEKVCYLHNNGILICDLDMQNILVEGLGTTDVRTYLIDTDSYQVGEGTRTKYRADVARPLCTPPELIGEKVGQVTRTFQNENFSIAVLLFMILIPNQDPYAMKGGSGSQVDGVKDGLFPYPKSSQQSDDKVPNDRAKRIWSYLPMKEMFWNNLNRDGSCYSPENRASVNAWLKVMKEYKQQLGNGAIADSNPEGLKAFPSKKKEATKSKPSETAKKKADSVASSVSDRKKAEMRRREKSAFLEKIKILDEVSKAYGHGFLENDDAGWIVCSLLPIAFAVVFFFLDPLQLISKNYFANDAESDSNFVNLVVMQLPLFFGLFCWAATIQAYWWISDHVFGAIASKYRKEYSRVSDAYPLSSLVDKHKLQRARWLLRCRGIIGFAFIAFVTIIFGFAIYVVTCTAWNFAL